MKKKLLASLFVLGTTAGAFSPTTILATDVIGEPTADIQINGSLGLDNTDPEEEIEEGDTNWINVTLDTATIFCNLAGTTSINSPTYTIANNSGRPVAVSVKNFASNSGDYSAISALDIVSPSPLSASRRLITTGQLEDFVPESSGVMFTLANHEGRLTATGNTTNPSATTFSYRGAVTSPDVSEASPSFTLTLQLDAVNF